jgi:asparagine synthetase B (glutamine-hydrolysing)
VYNFRLLARQLAGSASAYRSDGQSLLPAHARWGSMFVRQLRGEYALALADFSASTLILCAGVFPIKPLFYARWRAPDGRVHLGAASYRSALERLGAPAAAIVAFPANALLSFDMGGSFASARQKLRVRTFDLRQHKQSTADWQRAFDRAVRARADTRRGLFVGLSDGYDSGAVALALARTRAPLSVIRAGDQEIDAVVSARIASLRATGGLLNHTVHAPMGVRQLRRLVRHVAALEPCTLFWPAADGNWSAPQRLHDMPSALGLALLAQVAQSLSLRVLLSGSGADEIISDYAVDGVATASLSCFGGRTPADLAAPGFFPWCNYFERTQRNLLLREEIVAGAHGIEARFPFLDADVVQESLWLDARLKSSEYKRPVADLLRSARPAFPFVAGHKRLFAPATYAAIRRAAAAGNITRYTNEQSSAGS